MHVVITGGGVLGLLSAYYLLENPNVSVTLLEGENRVAARASGANAAQLSYTYVNPLGQPSLFAMLPGVVLGTNPGLRIEKWEAALIPWGLQLLFNSWPARFKKNRDALLELSLESRDLFQRLLRATSIRFRPHTVGKMQLYSTRQGLDDGEHWARQLSSRGIDLEILGASATAARLPGFDLSSHPLHGALYSGIDEAAGCQHFCDDLLGWLRANRPGFSIRLGSRVKRFEKAKGKIAVALLSNGEACKGDAFLLCAGAESNALMEPLGLSLPIYPVKGYTLEFARPASISLACSITDHAQKLVFVPFGERMLVSGMFHFAGHDRTIPDPVVRHIIKAARTRLPTLGDPLVTRAGHRPSTPNGFPIIGARGFSNLFINGGQGMYGWTLAAASSARIARIIQA